MFLFPPFSADPVLPGRMAAISGLLRDRRAAPYPIARPDRPTWPAAAARRL